MKLYGSTTTTVDGSRETPKALADALAVVRQYATPRGVGFAVLTVGTETLMLADHTSLRGAYGKEGEGKPFACHLNPIGGLKTADGLKLSASAQVKLTAKEYAKAQEPTAKPRKAGKAGKARRS